MGEMKITVENNTRYIERPQFRIKVFISGNKKLDIDQCTSELELREVITEIKNDLK